MKLQGMNGTDFGLEIVDYEFPDLKSSANDTDLDWLMIRITAKDDRISWDVVEPCLEAIEALTLCKWFETVAQGNDETHIFADSGFTEPELIIDLVASTPERVTIRIKCSHYSIYKNRTRSIQSVFLCEVTRTQLKQVAYEWCAEVQRFPNRRKPRA
jgi:hypothetical protein